ncbi:hypothetical protein QTN24_02530 [Cupriavidus sp. SZY C1]|uniref:hypothetical protein n=1 Tax=Cupriavidus sp. SZY C1 TaxID=3055037 RepID=UPI0028B54C63|nr:hypothetical protein [Cupriavidus sp. SZY C1]MDT6960361.1 hypothetical protein [Cupriavidus sp. SZY C1]
MYKNHYENSVGVPRTRGHQHLLLAVGTAVALVFLLSAWFMPMWETNDDVGMSMIAHGYGFVAESSPNLIFSNVIWGRIVRAMPQFGGVVGYTVASTLVIVLAGAAILYFMMRLGVARLHAVLAVALIFLWPVLFPQFTLNAGLLAVAAVLGWRTFAETGEMSSLAVASLLGFFAYLIRDQEFWLVLAVGLPFLPWKALARQRAMQASVVLLAVMIGGAAYLNKAAYDTEAWKSFHAFNIARAPYTDFRAGVQVKGRPDVLARHGFSANDIDLVSDWFFVDPHLMDPAKLNGMLDDIKLHEWVQRGFGLGIESLRQLLVDQMWPLLACACLIAFVSPSRVVIMLGVLVVAAVFALGAIGRPGVTRVYYPLAAFLLVAAICALPARPARSRGIATLALVLAGAAALHAAWPHQVEARSRVAQTRLQLEGVPKGTLFVWGPAFPYEAAFTPFHGIPDARSVQIYPMGVSTLAPFSVAMQEEQAGRGFLARLTTEAGLNISMPYGRLERLRTYCREHLQSTLDDKVIHERPGFVIHHVRCLRPGSTRGTQAAVDKH